jgi:O-antigen/teichoic acid export membrane protein
MIETAPMEKPSEKMAAQRQGSRNFLRGSSLLLVGRVLSISINFAVQVLAVRYLAKADYGAFAWAQSIAAMAASTVLLGLNRGVGRFAPIQHERREYGAMFGTMALSLGTVTGLGFFVVALVLGLQGLLVQRVDEVSVGLLVILIGLTPLDALDAMFENLLAVFAGARAIFFRRYVLAPGLKLAAVLLVMAVQGSVRMLAVGYLIAGVVGIAMYTVLLWRLLAREGLLSYCHPQRMVLRARELFGFSFPLLTTDLLLAVETPMVVVILERWHSTLEVAELRAVAPVAGLCLVVFQTFKILFKSQAARFYARDDRAGLHDLYWRSAAWLTVLTFPLFAGCFFLAEPLTVLLFGDRYAQAGVLLAILALGKFFNSALGMNTFMLQVFAHVRLILAVNAATAALGLGLCLWLIPSYGAIGGAWATTATIALRNVFYEIALVTTTHVGGVPRGVLRVYGCVLLLSGGLYALLSLSGSVLVLLPAVVGASVFLAWANRRFLDVLGTFPELGKVPLLRRMLGVQAG